MANFCCSIEMEPRTLNQGQLNYAREIAVDIVQKKETVEPPSILSEGLKPVVEIKETVVVVVSDTNPPDKATEESSGEVVKTERSTDVGTCCQCSCTNAVVIEDEVLVKEPVSAPF